MNHILYHGGVPGLKPGDLIQPGHTRQTMDDCPICRMREEQGVDAPFDATHHPDSVYCTPVRLYARYHAGLYGHGDVYQVTPIGDLTRSSEDTIESYRCGLLRVVRVVEARVELTWKDRRRLDRLWANADRTHGHVASTLDALPRNATPRMINDWQRRQLLIAERLLRQ